MTKYLVNFFDCEFKKLENVSLTTLYVGCCKCKNHRDIEWYRKTRYRKARLCETPRQGIFLWARDTLIARDTFFTGFPLFSKFKTVRLLLRKNDTSRPTKFDQNFVRLTFCRGHSTPLIMHELSQTGKLASTSQIAVYLSYTGIDKIS